MLRFIRKYQLIILVVGGSLLMVVFLLQPVLTRLAPSPLKSKVATLEDGSKFTRGDIQQANLAISLLKRVNPRALATREAGGLGLDTSSESNVALHWLLLVKQAENAGLVGEAGDGASWINQIAQTEAFILTNTERQQGMFRSQEELELRQTQLQEQIIVQLNRNANLSAANAGGSIDDVYRILAQARGVYRLISSIQTMPAFSDTRAIQAAHDLADTVAINASVIDSNLIVSSIPEPSDDQLQAFFDTYKGQSSDENEFRIGYTQPTRIQLAWMTFDKNVFMNTVQVDRVELNKIWRSNRDQYPGDFGLEKINLERQFREEQALLMMTQADRVIRAQVVMATKGLPTENGLLELPEDWESNRPRLETISDLIVARVNEQFEVSLPTPAITMIGDRWLTASDVIALPGYGTSQYRVGSRQIPAYSLTQFFELTEPNTTGLDVQVGLPLVDPAAEDQNGNRFYAVVLDVRPAGAADTIADVGREQVVNDFKAVEAFKVLEGRIEEFKAAIAANGDIAPAIDLASALSTDQENLVRPGVLQNILVMKDNIAPGRIANSVDNRLNTEAFRSAVLAAAADLDPLADPETIAANPIPVVVKLPGSKSIGLSIVVAPRPVTSEQFSVIARSIISAAAQRELADANTDMQDPFSFAALSTRYGLTKLDTDDEDDDSMGESESAAG